MNNFPNEDIDQVNLLSSKSDLSDNYFNNKYIMSDYEENKDIRINKFSEIKEEEEESSTKRKLNSEMTKNENLPLQIDPNRKSIYNFLINSSNSEINVNTSKDESYNNSIDHLKMENLYLEDGSITTNLMNPYFKNNNNNNNNDNNNNNNNNNNLEKEKIEQLKNEIQKVIDEKEKENMDLESSKEIDYHLLCSISSQRMKYENIENLENNEIDFELNEKKRNEKELKFKEQITNELKPKVYDEIYKNEYNKIYDVIKFEIENELRNNLEKDYNEEINYIKKNLDIFQKNKKEEIEREIHDKCYNEMEEEIIKVCEIKDKEFKLKNIQKLEKFKKKLENDLNEEYEKKKNDLQKEINKLKTKIFQSHYKEKIKMNKINSLRKNIEKYNIENIKGIETIDKMINSKDIEETELNADDENSSINNNKKIKYKKYAEDILDNNIENTPNVKKKSISKVNSKKSIHSNYNTIINRPKLDDIIINDDNNNKSKLTRNDNNNNNDIDCFDNKSNIIDNSINLIEINKRIKNRRNSKSVNKTFNFIEPKISSNSSYYGYNSNNQMSNNNSFYSQKINLNKNFFPMSPIYSYKNIGAYNNIKTNYNSNQTSNLNTKTNIDFNQNEIENKKKELKLNLQKQNENIINKSKIDIPYNYNINNSNINNSKNTKRKAIFYSVQINKNIPISISEFGKYLITHIEKEEKYKILYFNEIKKFKQEIQKIFKQSKRTDHFLTECLFDLWNKVNTSYYTRYEILKQIIKFPADKLYEFLDVETEFLSNYYHISKNIFKEIEKRENLKSKLQTKANRNELNLNDKENLDDITKNLEFLIQNFQNKFKKLDIIWKGLRYSWFMNYENWFYDMEKKQNNNHNLKI